MSEPEPRVWVLEFAAPDVWLNSNDRRHHFEAARIVSRWRRDTYRYARAAKLPTGLERVRIDALLMFNRATRRDEMNFQPTLKACVDGLSRPLRNAVGYGLIPDDTAQYLDGPYITLAVLPKVNGRPQLVGRVRLTITELAPVGHPTEADISPDGQR